MISPLHFLFFNILFFFFIHCVVNVYIFCCLSEITNSWSFKKFYSFKKWFWIYKFCAYIIYHFTFLRFISLFYYFLILLLELDYFHSIWKLLITWVFKVMNFSVTSPKIWIQSSGIELGAQGCKSTGWGLKQARFGHMPLTKSKDRETSQCLRLDHSQGLFSSREFLLKGKFGIPSGDAFLTGSFTWVKK